MSGTYHASFCAIVRFVFINVDLPMYRDSI